MEEQKDRSDQPLPGSVSNQNSEEQPGEGVDGASRPKDDDKGEESPLHGGAGEGSQSTGHPENAG